MPTSDPPPAYVPGGPWPRPETRTARDQDPMSLLSAGVDLFDAGYYWEAHEAWEALWHAYGRTGTRADLVKALIKLAAAGVKVRQQQPRGVVTHARRAAELLAGLPTDFPVWFPIERLIARATHLADHPPHGPGPAEARVAIVFAWKLADLIRP